MNKKIEAFKEEYFSDYKVDVYNFLTHEQLEIVNKLGTNIENKKYSTYDFEKMQSKIIEYYGNRENLKKIGVSNEEYEDILKVIGKISEEYKI